MTKELARLGLSPSRAISLVMTYSSNNARCEPRDVLLI